MNNDLISRKALLEAYDKAHQGPPGGARKLIEEAPGVDAIEVVRCEECKYRTYDKYFKRHYCFNKQGLKLVVAESDFCPSGERKEK